MFKAKKKFVVVGAAAATMALSGVAFALWTANATGSTSTKALTAVTVTVTGATPTADLYPGFDEGDLSFTLDNDNPYPVTFASMTAGTVTSSNQAACPASNVTVANATGLSLAVPAESTSSTLTIDDVVTMASAAPDGCQGVTFTVAVSLTGTQS